MGGDGRSHPSGPASPEHGSDDSRAAAIRFYFDFSCPYAYLGSRHLDRIEAQAGRDVVLRPFLLGGVFRAIGQVQNISATLSPPKKAHNRADLIRQAAWVGAPLRKPFRHPNRTVLALRALLCAPPTHHRPLMDALFAVYWQRGEDISDPAVVAAAVARVGLDPVPLMQAAQGEAVRAELRERTDEALAAGVFGAPAYVVDGELFWGADRVDMVIRAAREGWNPVADADDFDFNQETTA